MAPRAVFVLDATCTPLQDRYTEPISRDPAREHTPRPCGVPHAAEGRRIVANFYIALWSIGLLLALVLDVRNDGRRR